MKHYKLDAWGGRVLPCLLSAACLVVAPVAARATDWYVDGLHGRPTNKGTATSPFLTGWNAMDVVKPGDTVHVLPTVAYAQLGVTVSGTASQPITVVGTGSGSNLTRVAGIGTDSAIWINADYVVVKNFDASALGQFPAVSVAPDRHHVTISYNTVHDAGGSGINTIGDDYVHVTHNIVYGNAKNTKDFWQGSGISLLGALDVDNYTGVKNIVDSNIVYANTNVPYCFTAYCFAHTLDSDGSGIILDDFRRERFDHIAYRGQTLISNNVVFGNGGRGIYMYRSDHAVMIGNTVAFDNLDPYGGNWHPGEIGLDQVADVLIFNNIMYNDGKDGPNRTGTAPNFHVSFSAENCSTGTGSIVVGNNLMFAPPGGGPSMSYLRDNLNPFVFTGNFWADPRLKMASLDPRLADYRPVSGSPALHAGTPEHSLTFDALPVRRAVPNSIGAYEAAAP